MVDSSVEELKEVLNEETFNLEYHRLDDTRSLRFTATKHMTSFLANLDEFKQSGKFCDVLLRTREEPYKFIKTHKIVLASSTPYFKAMLAGGFRENNDCETITIDNLNYSTLETLIDFIYTSRIVIRETNVQNLLPAAILLQIEDVVNACCIYLSQNMDSNNCIGIEQFAVEYGCIHLAK
jgi:hypothetical protein